MIEHISVSQARTFLKCQKQWAFKYIEKIPARPSVRVALGIGVHAGLAQANMQRMAGISPDIDIVLETTHNELTTIFGENEYVFDELRNESDTFARADRIIRAASPRLDYVTGLPMLVEHAIADEIVFENGVKLVGYIDLVDANGVISDFKVGARAKSQGDVDQDLQLALYAYAINSSADAVNTQLVSVSNKDGDVKKVDTWKSHRDMENAYNIMSSVSHQIQSCCESGNFIPNTEGWHCSESYCDWYNHCEYGGKK